MDPLTTLDWADKILLCVIAVTLASALLALFVVVARSAGTPAPRREERAGLADPTNDADGADDLGATPELAYTRAFEITRDVRDETAAVEGALLGVLAAVAAVIVLAFTSDSQIGGVATGLLYGSFMACAVGFAFDRLRGAPEQESPVRFLTDLFEAPDGAQAAAAQDLVGRLKHAYRTLKIKRRWALAAVALLICGMLAGGGHKMLQSSQNEPRTGLCGSGQRAAAGDCGKGR